MSWKNSARIGKLYKTKCQYKDGAGCGLNSSGSEYNPVANSCIRVNEISVYTNA